MRSDQVPLLWLCGPSGVGKSAVAWEIVTRLSRTGVRVGYVDIDQIGMCYPTRSDDPGNDRLMGHNLAAMWPNFRTVGVERFVVSGCIDTPSLVPVYTNLPGSALTLCRLRADRRELRARFLGRGRYVDLVDAALSEADTLDRSDFADLCIDTSGLSVPEVAALVRERAGWPVLRG